MPDVPDLLRKLTTEILRHLSRFPWEAGGERSWRLL